MVQDCPLNEENLKSSSATSLSRSSESLILKDTFAILKNYSDQFSCAKLVMVCACGELYQQNIKKKTESFPSVPPPPPK